MGRHADGVELRDGGEHREGRAVCADDDSGHRHPPAEHRADHDRDGLHRREGEQKRERNKKKGSLLGERFSPSDFGGICAKKKCMPENRGRHTIFSNIFITNI